MNAIANIAPGLPAPSQPLSEALSIAARNAAYAGPAMALTATPHLRTEAARRANLLEQALAPLPADSDRIRRWLLELAKVKKFIPSDLQGAVQLMARFLADLPAQCFTGRTLEDAAAAFPAWPDYAELKAHLLGVVRPARAEIEALRRVAAAPDPEPPREPGQRTEAERQYVRAKVEEFHRDMADRRAEEAARNPRAIAAQALPLHHGHLIEAYRQQALKGGPAAMLAQTRLAALERGMTTTRMQEA